ncbi:hypothetical protein [Colwellia echini]|uniref:Uncharacterized protein n=1 Tax=Colwellia echini TaxID=1982103 RepID=A0ABY3N0B9_9GAMM|nr:hypothetical protein [Colwellia echini]TYK66821.1 hypothetical protein CWS31_003295 [Colwellia echini]
MAIEDPDGWVFLRFTSENGDLYYKVFGTWRGGGYGSSEDWRLSSGCQLSDIKDAGVFWLVPQVSGSVYELPKKTDGFYTRYTGGVLDDILKASGTGGITIEKVTLADELDLYSITPQRQ